VNQGTVNVILGSGGAIGTPLALQLVAEGERVHAVSRGGKAPAGTQPVRADLTDAGQTEAAVPEGATVFLLVGLPYDARVWKVQWPRIIRNAAAACRSKGARLIFLDNVYMYGAVDGPMTEDTPIRPSSEKGRIRADVAGYLLAEMQSGRVTASIARAADFYGPHATASSIPYVLALEPLMRGRRPRWLIDARKLHSYSYTMDCAKALRLLARAQDSFGQVWHLPTMHPPITGDEFIRIAAKTLGTPAGYSILSRPMLALAGLFNRQILELSRMTYQNDRDYLFDSTKFEKRFGFQPTSYQAGIEETLRFASHGAAPSAKEAARSG